MDIGKHAEDDYELARMSSYKYKLYSSSTLFKISVYSYDRKTE